MAALPVIDADNWYETIRMARRRHADPRALDQAVLPLQHVACARPRPRSAVRHRPRPFQPAPPRARWSRERSARLRGQPHAFRPYRLPSRISRPLRAPRRGGDPRRPAQRMDAGRPLCDRRDVRRHAGGLGRRALPDPAGAGRSRRSKTATSIDLGDRAFEVIHTPGHSPGGIALYEPKTGILLSGDIVYDGPLIDDAYHSLRRRLCRDAGAHARPRRVGRPWRPFPELRPDALPPAHRRISRA